jgi:hypothetical protein
MRHAPTTLLVLVAGSLAGHFVGSAVALEPPKELHEGLALFEQSTRSSVQMEVALPESISATRLRHVLDVINGAPLGDASKTFTPDFLEYISAEEIATELASVGTSFDGEKVIVVEVDSREERPDTITATVSSRRGRAFLTIFVLVNEDTGLVSALRIDPAGNPGGGPAPRGPASWGDFAGELDDLPGEVSFGAWALVQSEGGTQELLPVAGQNEHRALAIGSSFKLWVLGALAEEVLLTPKEDAAQEAATDQPSASPAKPARAWTDTLSVRDALKSLPSGTLQLREEGTTISLAQASMQMISISDNTATDHLLHTLGRQRVEAFMTSVVAVPERNVPLLSTREAFVLKLSSDDALLERFLASSAGERRGMLEGELASMKPDLASAGDWDSPRLIEQVEWFASAHDCARTLARLRELELWAQRDPALVQAGAAKPLSDALRANPGLSLDAQVWKSAAFKGGSEPGVLHSCWLLERADGKWFVFSLGWNNTKELIDQEAFLRLAYQGVDLLSRDGLAEGQTLPAATPPAQAPERVPTRPEPASTPEPTGKPTTPAVRPT